jgi:hypothetical protein
MGDAAAAQSLTHITVMSDRFGFVGAFPSDAAATAVAQRYPGVPLLAHRFPAADGPADAVWVVLYRDSDAVAFVSNSRAEAARVQAAYVAVGLAHDEPLDYWEQPLGAIAGPTLDRLAAQAAARKEKEAGPVDGPDLEARFSILSAVVPVDATAAAVAAPANTAGPGTSADAGADADADVDADTVPTAGMDYATFIASLGPPDPLVLDSHRRWVEDGSAASPGEDDAGPRS